MNGKLRRWLEGLCHPQSDGTWMVEAPVVQAALAPAFVLPDEAAKEAYLAQAVRLGRFHLVGGFVALGVFLGSLAAQGPVFALVPYNLLDALLFVFLLLVASQVFWLAVARSADRNFQNWLGEMAVGETRTPSPTADRWLELSLCRPGWMVVIEAIAYTTVFVSTSYQLIDRRLEQCSRAFGRIEAGNSENSGSATWCFGTFDLFLVAILIGGAVFVAASFWRSWREWRRWDKRHA